MRAFLDIETSGLDPFDHDELNALLAALPMRSDGELTGTRRLFSGREADDIRSAIRTKVGRIVRDEEMRHAATGR